MSAFLTVRLWPEGRSSDGAEPRCGGEKKEKTEQGGLLSCLCVLTNQRRHAESLSRSPRGGLTATWPAVQAGYHLGGPSGSTEKKKRLNGRNRRGDETSRHRRGRGAQEGVTKRAAQARWPQFSQCRKHEDNMSGLVTKGRVRSTALNTFSQIFHYSGRDVSKLFSIHF